MLLVEVVEEKKRIVGREWGRDGGNRSIFINQENSFLFMFFIYVVAIISS